MTEPTHFVEDNAASQQELRALVARLSEADLRRDVGDGWTVATSLAHAAFYVIPFRGGKDSRHQIERQDTVDRGPIGVNGEGDAEIAEGKVG